MTMTDSPRRTTRAPTPSSSPAQRLQSRFAAVRVSFTWLGVRKTLTTDQKAQAAEPFGAEGQYLSASKKLLDTKNTEFREVTALRNRIVSYWKGMTLPYPEPGLRLIRQDQIETFNDVITDMRNQLQEAVVHLDEHYEVLKAAAQERLGSLYNPGDYPSTLRGMFSVEWEFPSVTPPDYLAQLNPQIYEAEKARIAARFDEAVRLAEEAFTSELAKLVGHLTERLSGSGEEGQKKVFRDTAVTNLREFFERFRCLNVHSNAQLDELVATAQKAVQGITAQDLRDQEGLRKQVSVQMATLTATLEGMLVDQPRRRILRPLPPSQQVA